MDGKQCGRVIVNTLAFHVGRVTIIGFLFRRLFGNPLPALNYSSEFSVKVKHKSDKRVKKTLWETCSAAVWRLMVKMLISEGICCVST